MRVINEVKVLTFWIGEVLKGPMSNQGKIVKKRFHKQNGQYQVPVQVYNKSVQSILSTNWSFVHRILEVMGNLSGYLS